MWVSQQEWQAAGASQPAVSVSYRLTLPSGRYRLNIDGKEYEIAVPAVDIQKNIQLG